MAGKTFYLKPAHEVLLHALAEAEAVTVGQVLTRLFARGITDAARESPLGKSLVAALSSELEPAGAILRRMNVEATPASLALACAFLREFANAGQIRRELIAPGITEAFAAKEG